MGSHVSTANNGTIALSTTSNDEMKLNRSSKKRHRLESPAKDDPKAEGVGDENNGRPSKMPKKDPAVKLKSLIIPVHDKSGLAADHSVYSDEKGVIYDATLNQTNIQANCNKYYLMQILVSNDGIFRLWTHWGRVGERGNGKILHVDTEADAIRRFSEIFQSKCGYKWTNRWATPKPNRYAFIEKDYEVASEDVKAADGSGTKQKSNEANKPTKNGDSKLPGPVQQLMMLIFNNLSFAKALEDMHYDAQALPLGKLGKKTLQTGFKKLQELADVLAKTTAPTDPDIARLTDEYYTLIPHCSKRKKPPPIENLTALKKEIQLLETLSDLEIANAIMQGKSHVKLINPLDKQYEALGLQQTTVLYRKSAEFKELVNYLHNSNSSSHGICFSVKEIFRIERNGERERFNTSKFANLDGSNRRLLWHGSRTANFGGILSQGLRIAPPEAPRSGYMFGKGIYLADISSKSAQYCCSRFSDGGSSLLLLCEVELGRPMLELYSGNANAHAISACQGSIATLGIGRLQHPKWKDASCVHPDLKGVEMPNATPSSLQSINNNSTLYHNEYIVYDPAQVMLRYLFRVSVKRAR